MSSSPSSVSVQNAAVTREAKTVVRTCQPCSRRLMNDVIDQADTPPKAIGYECIGRDDEPQWSKMRAGVRPFDLDHIDTLPRPIRVEWLIRRAQAEGLKCAIRTWSPLPTRCSDWWSSW